MATTEILQFAGGVSANVLTQADYAALSALLENGFVSGPAEADQLNKVWRQSSFIAAGIANWLVNLGIDVPDDGDLAALVAEIQAGLNAYLSKDVAGSSNVTLDPETEANFPIINLHGALTGSINVIVPTAPGIWNFANNTTGAHTLTIKTASGTGIVITQGVSLVLYCDGTNVYSSSAQAESLGVGQTYQDVTGSRIIGTTYTNSSGNPIFVSYSSGGASSSSNKGYVDGVAIQDLEINVGVSTQVSNVSFVVPNGSTYKITGTGSGTWFELR